MNRYYKVQLIADREALHLYIARQGRYNVEGYAGFDGVAASLDAARLRERRDLTHGQVQTLLAAIGRLKGYDVWVPANNAAALDWTLLKSRFPLRSALASRKGTTESSTF